MNPQDSLQSPYMTAAEAAVYLRYASVRALYKAIPQLHIPVCRRGGKTFLFDRRDLDRWLRRGVTTRRSQQAASKLVLAHRAVSE